ncbi:MAG TPA: arylsulfatase [Armatimonadota bacterium]|jgi:arylsulfatase A-like enzyme
MLIPPNIVYILADDMGYGDVSCLNAASKIHTQQLDRLVAEGMQFTDAHASSAVCTPSRYSILTGRYNWRSELKEGVTWGDSPHLIEDGHLTVASFLKQHGYTTTCIGKWHLGMDWARKGADDLDFTQPIANGPCAVGFDSYFGISASLDMPPYVYIENERVTALPDRIVPEGVGKSFWREGPIAPDFQHADVLPTLTRKAVDYITRQAGTPQPFFLYFPLPAPHTPILPAPAFDGKSATNAYGDFCLMVDDVVGQVLAALERAGVAENTLLIFTSDNGCSPQADFAELAACGHYPSFHFRGHKADIYEGGHRIPLLLRWPAQVRAGSVCDDTVCLVDLLATCAEILGESLPETAGEDSVSNLPLWLDAPHAVPIREATVHHSFDGSFSIRQGRWKLELCPGSGGWSWPRPGAECDGLPPIQLYDMTIDVSERQNVYAEHPEIVRQLTELLARYVRTGRSTPGAPQPNTGPAYWPQLHWLSAEETHKC